MWHTFCIHPCFHLSISSLFANSSPIVCYSSFLLITFEYKLLFTEYLLFYPKKLQSYYSFYTQHVFYILIVQVYCNKRNIFVLNSFRLSPLLHVKSFSYHPFLHYILGQGCYYYCSSHILHLIFICHDCYSLCHTFPSAL